MSESKASLLTLNKIKYASVLVLVAVILILYASATKLNFFGDDYLFIEVAGRLSFWQYLSFYFDPRVQTAWYRPMQGMRYGIIYALFGANPAAYHWVNVLVHVANCLLLFAIITRVSRRWQLALLAVLIYAGLPLYSVTVFWPGVADFVMTLFYLSSVLFWVLYLQEFKPVFFLGSVIFFILALMTKELAVTLPITLIVIDRLILGSSARLRALAKRYLLYFLILALYLPMEYLIQSRGIFVNAYGYGASSPLVENFLQYLAAFFFPWGMPSPWNYLWIVLAVFLFAFVVISKKSLALIGLGVIGLITFLPVIPFPWFAARYLYMPTMIFATILALWIEWVSSWLSRANWYMLALSAAIALITIGHGFSLDAAAADFAEISRQSRVPFRDITQRHPQFPNDTLLYFINPPSPTAEYSGMFFIRYGPAVAVASNETRSAIANLRAHQNSYLIYFDEERRTREILVDRDPQARVQPELPVAFGESIRLERYELANTRAKRGEAIGLILYFRSKGTEASAFSVSLDLVNNATGKLIASHQQQLPLGDDPNVLITMPLIISIPFDSPISGENRLELTVLDARGQLLGNKISFAPLGILE